MVKTGLVISLTEPQVFLRGPATGEDSRGRRAQVREDGPPALLRGVLSLNLSKPSRIKRIELTLEGKARTEWPEGIGARRTEIFEEHTIFEATTTFFVYDRAASAASARRAASVGPGVLLDDDEFQRGARGLPPPGGDSGASSRRVSILVGAGEDEDEQRGRGREGRQGLRSFSAMPISAVPSRLHSPDRSSGFHGHGHVSSHGGSSSSGSSPAAVETQAARLKLEAHESYKRGPSPAYTPVADPRLHAHSSAASISGGEPSAPPAVTTTTTDGPNGANSVLSPIMSADPSPYQSRSSSQPEDAAAAAAAAAAGGERRPIRPSMPMHVASSTADSSSSAQSSTEDLAHAGADDGGDETPDSPSRAPTPTPNGSPTQTVNGDHAPSQAPAPPSSTVVERAAAVLAASGTPSASAPASPIGQHGVLAHQLSAASSHPSSIRSRHSLSLEHGPAGSATSSVLNSPAPRAHPPLPPTTTSTAARAAPPPSGSDDLSALPPSARSSSSQRRPSRDGSPFGAPHPPLPPQPKRTESRSRASRFNFAGVTSALRSMSQDIKDRVGHSSSAASLAGASSSSTAAGRTGSHSGGHASTSSLAEPPASAAASGFGGSGTGGFGPSSTNGSGQDEYVPSFGRGGAASAPASAGGARGRRASPDRAPTSGKTSRSASRSRGRTAGLKVLNPASSLFSDGGGSADGDGDDADGGPHWKEFKKGTYHYPISFTIPSTTPPTIHADFGHVAYKLKAVVYRSGALTANLFEEKEVRMVACPGEDDTDESENVLVERQWEDQLRYLVALSGKSFPIGGSIPISIRLMPFEKMKIYRISVVLEEKIDYFAYDKKVARHEAVRRHQLLGLKHAPVGKVAPALLPITSDAADALSSSPLTPLAVAALDAGADADDAASSLLNPVGPWHFETALQVPDCNSRIHFTTKHAKTNMTVGHCLKIIFRVERGDDTLLDAKGKRKQFDIIIETPITVLDCRCNVQFIALPSYSTLTAHDREDVIASSCTCRTSAERRTASPATRHVPMPDVTGPSVPPPAFGGSGGPLPSSLISRTVGAGSHHSPSPHRRNGDDDEADAAYEASDQYARLVSGEETAVGMIPPSYEDVLTGHNHAGTITRTRDASRSMSRDPRASSRDVRGASRSRSRVAHAAGGASGLGTGPSSRSASPMPSSISIR